MQRSRKHQRDANRKCYDVIADEENDGSHGLTPGASDDRHANSLSITFSDYSDSASACVWSQLNYRNGIYHICTAGVCQQMSKLEIFAVANALQVATWGRPSHASLFQLELRRHAKFEVAEPIHCRIIAFLLLMHYFTLWPWHLTFDLEHCVTCCARFCDNFHQVWPSTTYTCLYITAFLCWYVMSRCNLDLWPLDLELSYFVNDNINYNYC